MVTFKWAVKGEVGSLKIGFYFGKVKLANWLKKLWEIYMYLSYFINWGK